MWLVAFTFCANVENIIFFDSHFKRLPSLFLLNPFFSSFSCIGAKKSPVMSDSLLSPLLDEQPLEKDERKKREEKRPFCYFLS